ncbi:MAG: type VII secretion protein EssC [Clostridium sp.]|nr:type VII secretion protein EssC [Clostridium sp.]
MIVSLKINQMLNTISLPDKAKGQYWLAMQNEYGGKRNLLEIEAIDGEWRLKSNRNASVYVSDGERPSKYVTLMAYGIYKVRLSDYEETAYVIAEPDTDDRKIYYKFSLQYPDMELNIGRSVDSDICFLLDSVSSEHAILTINNYEWVITDNNSTNGTFVNNEKVEGSRKLNYGDMIYIMGMKIVVCRGFLAINNPDNFVRVNTNLLSMMKNEEISELDEEDISVRQIDYYYRSPRFKRDIKEKKIVVDAPPSSYIKDEMPLIMVLGPSITMGIASITTAAYSIYNAMQNGNFGSAIPSLAMSFSMLLGTILWPVISKKYEKKKNKQKEDARLKKYTSYLENIKQRIKVEAKKQTEIIEENNNTAEYWADVIKNRSQNLWERAKGQDDFLDVRIGLGEREVKVALSYQERKFTMDEDDLQEQMLSICENPPKLYDVPVTVSLQKDNIFGIVGTEIKNINFLNSLIVKLAGQHSYDEVKFVFIMNQHQEQMLGYVRCLPHIWDDEYKVRYLATDYLEAKEISKYIEKEIEIRAGQKQTDETIDMKHFVIFVLDKQIADKTECLKQIYKNKNDIHMSIVYVADKMKNLPKECSKFIELEGETARLYDKNDITGKKPSIKPDFYTKDDLGEITSALANTQLDLVNSAYNLPKILTFLDMYGVGKIEHLNIETRWKENNPVKSLEAPIGMDTAGGLFKLDLHEKFHGPHGLVAGMTGSGKSEFIMTMILSLALNYHPYELAFVLIDYKGGGMAKAFEKLPHTAGIITNLDGAAVKRSLVSIQSELKRRQAVFSMAGQQVGESNIDIYKYQQLYREGKVTEPLPHLLIISDEFAELKTQQPEFMEQLVSAARIGRSLGVHLILATQKPAGVVDDQIWSNSRFRICLKVQDRADSMDMLKRPDAAGLADTGRFYLQVGYNELFELGQSAYAGAPYIPSEKVTKQRDTEVELLDRCGMVIASNKIDRKQTIAKTKKQLDEITAYISKVAQEENIKTRQLWLEPIPSEIIVDALKDKYKHTEQYYELNPIIGEYDDPARQRQCLLTLPLSREGNALIYGTAGNGKTTFLTTMLYSLVSSHNPDEIQIYILDFSSETLRVFRKAPHVGDVLVSGDDEKLNNLFKMINSEIAKRKQICANYGGDYASYVAKGNTDIPNILIAINNYAGFSELYEDYEEFVQYQSREGIKYGIYYVMTALSTNAVRYRLQQNFKQMFVLQMNDVGEYSTVLGSTGGMVPSHIKGRGLMKDANVYEFQTAYASYDIGNIFSNVNDYCEQLLEYYGERHTEIPELPEHVSADDFEDEKNISSFPIGIAKENVEVQSINLLQPPVTIVTGSNEGGIKKFMEGFLDGLTDVSDLQVTCIDGLGIWQEENMPCDLVNADFDDEIVTIFETVLYRNNHFKESGGVLSENDIYEQLVFVFYGFLDLRDKLTEDSLDKIKIVLEKNSPEYNVAFVIVDTTNDLLKYSREQWFKHHNANKEGIYIGNDIQSQFVLEVDVPGAEYKKPLEREFGYVISDRKAVLTKLVVSRTEVENE